MTKYFKDTSSLANNGLAMMTGDIMEPHSVIVKVIQDCQTNLIPFPVIRLWSVGSENVHNYKVGC